METMNQQEEQMQQPNKKLFMIIGGLVILIIIVVLGIVLVNSKKKTPTATGTDTSQTTNTDVTRGATNSTDKSGLSTKKNQIPSTSEISKTVLTWLNKQKGDNGVYYGQVTCHSSGICDKPVTTYQSGVSGIWGRFKTYQKTKNKSDLTILSNDLKTYGTNNNVFSLQNYALNCRLMYELSQSAAFSSEEQQYIKRICFHSQPYPPITDNPQFNTSQAVAKQPLASTNRAIVPDHLIYYANDTADFVARYEWTKESANLDGAKESFGYALTTYAKSNYSAANRGTPILGVAALDLYRATKDTQYFNLVNSIFNSLNATPCSTTENCANTAYFASLLNYAYNKPQYKKLYDQSIKILEASSYDIKGQTGFKTGVGAFRPLDSSENPLFDVTTNGFIVGVINML